MMRDEVGVTPRVPISVSHGRHHAFPGFVITASGTYLAAYRDADDHYVRVSERSLDDRGVIRMHASADGGGTWSASSVLQDDGYLDSRDPALTVLASGALLLSYFTYDDTVVHAYVRRSADEGATWDAAVEIAHPFATGSAVCAPIVELVDGTLLAPLFGRFEGDPDISSVVSASRDGGRHWQPLATIATGGGLQWTEPNLAVLSDGTVLCLIRQNAHPRRIHLSSSPDAGRTWTAPIAVFDGNGRPAVLPLDDGRLVMIYRANDGPTVARVSATQGSDWSAPILVDDTGVSTYAQMAQASDGTVPFVYSVESGRTESEVFLGRLVVR